MNTAKQHFCPLCGVSGEFIYQGLKDPIFGAPGCWNLRKCKGSDCGVIWMDPRPTPDDLEKAYATYYTHHDSESGISGSWRPLYQWLLQGYLANRFGYDSEQTGGFQKWLSSLIRFHPGFREDWDFKVMYLPASAMGRLLEVGCGSGDLIAFMKQKGWTVAGLDTDPVAVQKARSRGLQVYRGTLETAGFPSNDMDVIAMNHVIEHVPDPAKTLRECYRILKAGGRLMVTTPNHESWGHSLFRKNWRGLEPPRHLFVFNRNSLLRLIRQAGFRKVDLRSSVHGAGWIMIASRSIRNTGGFDAIRSVPFPVKLWARSMQMVEWGRLLRYPSAGEELTVIAEK
ncbi:MAG: class I SAM-dependent methyltransferase [Deltaproteobacteria bacterium]|nr:class I SAM-dependent methyltransferase [Deltaproteobacteria bacterium]